ncbi:ATPase family associated with various cellular activities (AAA) [Malonomonas rubra DSM 5091]|uniref:ATPase family associated with various cellular activities (AAA) n=1 Tax=Malonomonas rubra DSM 5091 TaxID=1122189 RepID=A0A1M6LZZ5_MALRU|nr:ATP-binding protein [Malonomonas rubra]SHJ76725.1 ATPase family associated with various cellular activities (AAA) [Malonomonas rubra DSM 5091]
MKADPFLQNATALNDELDWLFRVLDTRIKLHFEEDCDYRDVFEISAPALNDQSSFARFIQHYQLTEAERLVLILALTPHVRPQLLDVLFTKNSVSNRDFTEFGGRSSASFGGFLPSAETALFLLAGNDLARRFSFHYLFDADHVFSEHGIITLEKMQPGEPHLNGILSVNREIIELVTTGKVGRPMFGADFPAKRITTEMEWDDLVLDPETFEDVLEIKSWLAHGDTLLYELGLAKKLKPGYRSLFYGPPGTGKTLTASLLGKSFERDVYRIDLSAVISKYIGETEKNLEKIFQKAELRDWILFFDEADALFGKRTKISSSHDRFANQEVSYLLQRVEDYPGVVILASNMRANLDDAFVRRFQSIIHFPMPDARERLQLWRSAFSEKTDLAEKVDLKEIAGRYELSGGSIMNVVRYATLRALEREERTISNGDLQEGIRKEFQKEGKTI